MDLSDFLKEITSLIPNGTVHHRLCVLTGFQGMESI